MIQLVIINILEKIESLNQDIKVIKVNQMNIFDLKHNII